jgi:hypothetical protein
MASWTAPVITTPASRYRVSIDVVTGPADTATVAGRRLGEKSGRWIVAVNWLSGASGGTVCAGAAATSDRALSGPRDGSHGQTVNPTNTPARARRKWLSPKFAIDSAFTRPLPP